MTGKCTLFVCIVTAQQCKARTMSNLLAIEVNVYVKGEFFHKT